MNAKLESILSRRLLFLDGGFGTQLQARGLRPGEIPEDWNLTHPEAVRAVHADYFAAGSDIVCTNTFGANRAKYHGSQSLAEIIPAAIENARAAGAGKGLVALDVGPTGRLLKPVGDFAFDAAYEVFAEQIACGAKAGADLVAIETMGDVYELKAAVLAAKENCDLPVFATVALGENGKLLTGGDVECVAALLEGLRVDALGFNCGLGPDRMLPFVERLARVTTRPLIVKPNAGLPQVVDGKTVFKVGPEEFADDVAALVKAGASIVGGCCGTTPAHLAAVSARLSGAVPVAKAESAGTHAWISSGTHAVDIPIDDAILVGERINPTGKKNLKAALLAGDVDYVLREAVSQAEAGAQVLDVNVGVPGIDEPAVLQATVEAVQGVTDRPLQIDTSDPVALAQALRHYNGKALVNSVNGKEESLSTVLPLVAKYGGVVVALTLDETGIPPTVEGRLAIARKILARGEEYGLGPNDFVIDPLCLSVATAAPETVRTEFPGNVVLETVRRIKSELGCRTALGVSNISFGLPARPLLNGTFFSLALEAGLSAAIVNPLSVEMTTAYHAWRALTGRDGKCADWVTFAPTVTTTVAATPAGTAAMKSAGGGGEILGALNKAIRQGLKTDAARAAADCLAQGMKPLELIDREIVPALEFVGQGFEKGTLFLPQLLMAAEAASAAFVSVRAALAADPSAQGRGTRPRRVILATVKGDIHDIGKNICRALVENYGFDVLDLGRDVAPEKVLAAARENEVRLVGLSALMTTTVGAMEETVKLLHDELPGCQVVVGGAVLTADFAQQIGADFYARTAMDLVRICEEVFK